MTAPSQAAPRERLLAAADELFYEEGICSVGINRLLEHAGVARASLYSTFGSKQELVRAYLLGRSEAWREHVQTVLPVRWAEPRERLLGVFELLGESFADPSYNGCPFINASAEADSCEVVAHVRDEHRAWVRDLFGELGKAAGAREPQRLSDQLVLLYDGAMVGAQLDASPAAAATARAAAGALLDAALQDQ